MYPIKPGFEEIDLVPVHSLSWLFCSINSVAYPRMANPEHFHSKSNHFHRLWIQIPMHEYYDALSSCYDWSFQLRMMEHYYFRLYYLIQ